MHKYHDVVASIRSKKEMGWSHDVKRRQAVEMDLILLSMAIPLPPPTRNQPANSHIWWQASIGCV